MADVGQQNTFCMVRSGVCVRNKATEKAILKKGENYLKVFVQRIIVPDFISYE